jgi:hypothetical protein
MTFEEVVAQGLLALISEQGQVVTVIIICAYAAWRVGTKLLQRCEQREEAATAKWEQSSMQVAQIQLETAKQLSDVSSNLKEIRQDIKDHLRGSQ